MTRDAFKIFQEWAQTACSRCTKQIANSSTSLQERPTSWKCQQSRRSMALSPISSSPIATQLGIAADNLINWMKESNNYRHNSRSRLVVMIQIMGRIKWLEQYRDQAIARLRNIARLSIPLNRYVIPGSAVHIRLAHPSNRSYWPRTLFVWRGVSVWQYHIVS